MNWKDIKINELDWLRPETGYEPPESNERIDPYVLWGAATQFSGFTNQPEFRRSNPGEGLVSIIAMASSPGAIDSLNRKHGRWLQIPEVYLRPVPGTGVTRCYFTARVALNNVHRLRGLKEVTEWEFGLPVISIPGPGQPSSGRGRVAGSGSSSSKASDSPVHATQTVRAAAIIGVIDYGCAFMHSQFRTADFKSRIDRLWDQGQAAVEGSSLRNAKGPRSSSWSVPQTFRYGRELRREQINDELQSLKARQEAGHPVDEAETYRPWGYLLSDEAEPTSLTLDATHGTSVLDLAAGNIDPIAEQEDAASKADIVFVQLPLLTARDSSGGSLGVHVLDGIRYILDECDDSTKVVINLSYGTQAGPHDGSTLLERAMDDLLEVRKENFAIVLSAGNQRMARGHAKGSLSKGTRMTLRWNVLDTDPTDSFLEIWYPRTGTPVRVVVTSPSGERSGSVRSGRRRGLYADDGSCVAAVFHEDAVPNGADPMVLIALKPSSVLPDDLRLNARATPGVWKIELSTESKDPLEVHAWIERDDSPTRGPSRQSMFEGDGFCEEGTLNSLATGQHTIVVGGYRLSDGEEVEYSGRGPARGGARTAGCPDILGACEENEALRSIRVSAVRSGLPERISGTSAAAPVIARKLLSEMIGSEEPIGRKGWKPVLDTIAQSRGARATSAAATASQSEPASSQSKDTLRSTDLSSIGSPSPANNPPDLQFPYA